VAAGHKVWFGGTTSYIPRIKDTTSGGRRREEKERELIFLFFDV
jgi:hypothetical protein